LSIVFIGIFTCDMNCGTRPGGHFDSIARGD
jgi:hypothetical protein